MKKLITLCLTTIVCIALQAQDFAIKQLDASPRHQEWVIINNGDREINTFVVFPEVSEKAMAVILIHENRGLTDWVRSMADQMAAEGYIALAPDLLSDFSENFKKTSDFPVSDDARAAIYELNPDQVIEDLRAVQTYAQEMPASNDKIVVMGFCWGGSTTFSFATKAFELEAALVFYGSGPKNQEDFYSIETPVYGFYGSKDERVNATIQSTAEMMKVAGKTFDSVIYEGAGHAYMRAADAPDADDASKAAKAATMERIRKIFSEINKTDKEE